MVACKRGSRDIHTIMYLTEPQSKQIRELGRSLEMRTGVEFISAVVGKCDTYPEIPWKAFAMGSVLSALAAAVVVYLQPQWPSGGTALIHLAWILAAGATAAMLTPFWPAFGRLFLDRHRAEAEARQYAQGVFLEHQLFQTDRRQAVLLLIGIFEHQVVILPDTGVSEALPEAQLEAVIARLTPHLRRRDYFQALVEGISCIEAELVQAGFTAQGDPRNQIDTDLLQHKGDR